MGLFVVISLLAAVEPPPAVTRVLVHVTPERFSVGAGGEFVVQDLVSMLRLRLEPLGVVVDSASSAIAPGDAGLAPWVLNVTRERHVVETSVADPAGNLVVRRQLSIRGRRPHDLVQTIALSLLEGMAAHLDNLANALPQASEQPVDSQEAMAPPQASPTPPPLETRQIERRWRGGGHLQGLYARPGRFVIGGLGVSAEYLRARLVVVLLADVLLPRTAEGVGYRLHATSGSMYLGLGLAHEARAWRLGLDLGLAGRLTYVQSTGSQIRALTRSFVNGGAGGRLWTRYAVSDRVGVEVAIIARRYYPYQVFVSDGERLLDIGSMLVGASTGIHAAF